MKQTQSAGGVVVNPQGQVLIVNQRGKTWSLPKGHVDPGEEILAAAKREIYEESGVKELTLIKKLGNIERESMSTDGTEKEQKTIHIFLFSTNQMDLQPQDPHNPEAKWVEKEVATRMLSNIKDKEFFKTILKDISYNTDLNTRHSYERFFWQDSDIEILPPNPKYNKSQNK